MRVKPLLVSALILCLPHPPLSAQSSREEEAERHIQAAKLAQEKGDYVQAVAGYQAALKLMPEVPELYSNLGIAYYYQKEYGKAVEALLRALKEKPNLVGANLFLGMAYVRTAQFEKSIQPLEKAIAQDPKIRQAYINLSGSYEELGNDEDAVRVLQRAAKLFPDDIEVLYSLGTLHYHLMFRAYGKMARAAPNSYRYHQVMGQSFEQREEYPEAIVEFKEALKVNSQAPGLHYALGNVYWIQGHYADAMREFEAELEISPEDYMSTWKVGNIYLAERQYDKARPYLEKAIRVKPTLGEAYQDLGKLYLETHEHEKALDCLKKVVEMAPEEPTPHYLLAMTYRRMGKTAEAQTEMGMFEKLKGAEIERRRPPEAMFTVAGEKSKRTPSPDASDAQ
jgi:tetratricopeptide (TPR) repeat protein